MSSTAISLGKIPFDQQWFAKWFDSDHYHKLYAHRGETEAARFVDRLVHYLRPPKQSEALDLGCGAGRHARRLASHGLNVTAIDLSANSIARAKRSVSSVRFLRHDMRLPFGDHAFHFVFNFFTSFGFFNRDEHVNVIRNMATALKAGGTLLLDYMNATYAEKNLVVEDVQRTNGFAYRLSRWADSTHLFKRIVIEREGRHIGEHVERVAKLEINDFEKMFAPHGLKLEEVLGDYELGPYAAKTSPRMVLIARKAA